VRACPSAVLEMRMNGTPFSNLGVTSSMSTVSGEAGLQ
jgi:hypothetical protein